MVTAEEASQGEEAEVATSEVEIGTEEDLMETPEVVDWAKVPDPAEEQKDHNLIAKPNGAENHLMMAMKTMEHSQCGVQNQYS
jgi:hypothetical protein